MTPIPGLAVPNLSAAACPGLCTDCGVSRIRRLPAAPDDTPEPRR